MNLIIYWIYALVIFLITFIPGYAIANLFKNLNTCEKLAISFGFSFLIPIIMVPLFAFNLVFLGQFILIGVMIVSIWFLVKQRAELRIDIDAKFLILVLVIGIISKLFLQTLWEYPVMGGDWIRHTLQIPYAFEIGDWSPPLEKTPLFNLLIYSYHNLLGTSLYQYWVSQIISVIINSAYILPAYLIAKKAFGDSVAKISALFMLVTPFLIFNTIYTWPKNAAMYGILMMMYFLFFSEHDIKLRYTLAGFFAGIGFLFHSYALFYIGIAVLVLVYKEKMHKTLLSKDIISNLKNLSYFLVVLLIFLAPYFIWVYSYGTVSNSRTIYYPIAVKGYEAAFNQTPDELWKTFKATPLTEIVMPRISNAIVTFTPAALPVNPYATNFRTYDPIFYYTQDYPGALSTLMYLVVVIWFIKYIIGKTKTDPVLVSFLVVPWIIIMILYAWREWGLLTGILHPTLPLLIILGFNEIYNWNYKHKYFIIYVIFISAIVENIIFSRLISKFYYVEGGLQQVAKTGQQFIPDFQISNFVSAHFLLNRNIDLLYNFLFAAGLILLFYILLSKNKNK
ncbi:MAG: glycosyltransferase family 39 protein [Candidatus Methanoperedens sp.]